MAPVLSVVLSLMAGAVPQTNVGFVLGGAGTAVDTVLAACPRALESSAAASLTGSAACSEVRRVLLLADFNRTQFTPTPAAGQLDANTYFDTWVAPVLPALATFPVDWLSGPPNFFTVVDPTLPGNLDFATGFFTQLSLRVRNAATAASQSFGLVLPAVPASATSALCTVATAAAANGTIAWSWRATSASLSTTPSDEDATTFGYRAVAGACSALVGRPAFAELNAQGGWFASGRSPSQVTSWVRFVDGQVRAGANPGDAEVRAGGLLLRTLGGGSLDDLSPAAADLAAYLRNPSSSGGGGGTSSGGVNGGTGVGGTNGGGLLPTSGNKGGCGNPADGLALLSLAGLAPIVLRRRRGR